MLEGISSRLHVKKEYVTYKNKKYPLYCITGGKGQKVLLTAGMHGNEPAGVEALLAFMCGPIEKYLDTYAFTIIPCINPVGRALNIRKNPDIDLNRQFTSKKSPTEVKFVKRQIRGKYLFSFDLHEDPTDEAADNAPEETPPEELYLYEVSKKQQSKGRSILSKLEMAGFPLCKRKATYHESCENGLVWHYASSKETPGAFDDYLAKYTTNAFTLETPTCWPLKRRVKAHLIALDAALSLQQDKG